MDTNIGRGSNSYLLIFRKDGTMGKFNLWKMGISNWKLAEIIEQYKEGVSGRATVR
ncbi:MAG TPA: hypothetical protein VGE90_08210 [Chitinophaga sp.]